jgi:hypothetical protein
VCTRPYFYTASHQTAQSIIIIIIATELIELPLGGITLPRAGPKNKDFRPGPYEGVHVTVLYDRVYQTAPDAARRPLLLAHVLVHEITHVLQGVEHHSESGIMKAHWGPADCYAMADLALLPVGDSYYRKTYAGGAAVSADDCRRSGSGL